MRDDKQDLVLEILGNGKYRVDVASGIVYSFRRGRGEWVVLVPNKPKSGYLQYRLHLGRGKGKMVLVYGHVLVWMVVHGKYKPGMEVNHKDLDKRNNRIGNLELLSSSDNSKHALKNCIYGGEGVVRPIRKAQIDDIKFYLKGGLTNISEIARRIGCSRLATSYTIKKIQAGEPLKYENGDYVPSSRNKLWNNMNSEQRAEYIKERNRE